MTDSSSPKITATCGMCGQSGARSESRFNRSGFRVTETFCERCWETIEDAEREMARVGNRP